MNTCRPTLTTNGGRERERVCVCSGPGERENPYSLHLDQFFLITA